MITVRLDSRTRAALQRLAESRGQTRSEVIRDAILRMAEEAEDETTAYDRLAPFLGVVDSGGRDLARNSGKRFRETLKEQPEAHASG